MTSRKTIQVEDLKFETMLEIVEKEINVQAEIFNTRLEKQEEIIDKLQQEVILLKEQLRRK